MPTPQIYVEINGVPLAPGLRIVGKIKKTLKPELNSASLAINNLSPENITRVHEAKKQRLPLVVKAGIDGVVNQIVRTTISFADTEYDTKSGNIVTRVDTRDGEEGRQIFPDTNYPKGFTVVDILNALLALVPTLDATLLRAEIAKGTFNNAKLYSFKNGHATRGNVIDALNTIIVGAGGIRWTIQDDKIIILPANGLLPYTPILVAPETTLVGSPKITDTGVMGLSKFTPLITPGAPMTVKSRRLPSIFNGRCEEVEYIIDNYGDSWYSKFEATNVNDPTFADIDYLLVTDS